MKTALVTGSSGLVGSEAVRFLHAKGFRIFGMDNDMRAKFFGIEASTAPTAKFQTQSFENFQPVSLDVRNQSAVFEVFKDIGSDLELVVHTAAQPSHDWSAADPITDFEVNANGTLSLLEATRRFSPESTFIFTSTNKVYGDSPNKFDLENRESRFEPSDKFVASFGFDETMSLDQSTHSPFGVSKAAADLMVQEYGRYFGLNTGTFRGGCLTGPGHRGAKLHGFLSYLVKSVIQRGSYTVIGFGGKQVRDNIHSLDLLEAFWRFHENPRPGEVYNIGGGPEANVSIIEALALVAEISGVRPEVHFEPTERVGDHKWYVSNTQKFKKHFPGWEIQKDIRETLEEMVRAEIDSTSA